MALTFRLWLLGEVAMLPRSDPGIDRASLVTDRYIPCSCPKRAEGLEPFELQPIACIAMRPEVVGASNLPL